MRVCLSRSSYTNSGEVCESVAIIDRPTASSPARMPQRDTL